MDARIGSIRVRNVRGIRTLTLPVYGEHLILVGENGSGKSSVVDALEYYFTGHVARLEGRVDVNRHRCFPTLGGGPPEVALTFTGLRDVDPEVYVLRSYPLQRINVPESLAPLFFAAARCPFVLRRAQLLDFINARDSKRYQQISQLIGLEALDRIDDAWRKQQRLAQARIDDLERACNQNRAHLKEILGQPAEREAYMIRGINHRLQGVGLPPIRGMEALPQQEAALRQRCQSPDRIRQVDQLRALQKAVAQFGLDLDRVTVARHGLLKASQRFWEQSGALEDARLEPLLQEGCRILRSDLPQEHCPLCEAPLDDPKALRRRLEERLAVLKRLTQSRRAVAGQKRLLEGCLRDFQRAISGLVEAFTKQGLGQYLEMLTAAGRWTRAWLALLSDAEQDGLVGQALPDNRPLGALRAALPQISNTLEGCLEVALPTDAETEALNLLVTFAKAFEHWKQLRANEQALEQARFVQSQVDLVYNALIAARIRGLQRLGEALQADFQHLYTRLHPDEGYDAITLEVHEDRRSSVGLRVVFHQQAASHPLSYLSEGHLDSLGLCIFLAFIKHFNQAFRFIILDDILTTIDAGHRLQVAQLLAEEFSDYQLLITTHDRLWAEELGAIFPQARRYYLRPWRFETGAGCQQVPPSDWDYYRQQVEIGRPPDGIAGGGRNLERFLCQMRSNLRLSVPAKPGDDYTIGDLYGPFFRWLRDHKPITRPDWPDFTRDLQSMEAELGEVWRLRNWSGAHFNTWAAHVTPHEALSFLAAIERLVSAFSCPVCGKLVSYNEAAGVLQCPSCRPAPFPVVVYQYQPDWAMQAARMLALPNPQVRAHVAPMVQSAFGRFLHDMVHRLRLAIRPDEDVGLGCVPFFTWAAAHPRPEIPAWQERLAVAKDLLARYLEGAQWRPVPEAELEAFVAAMTRLTELFTCPACDHLLDYDPERAGYTCMCCGQQERGAGPIAAYWFVGGNR